jgi:glyoxylase-like metal-dependent hydrolase (beta-lactamase superfamily II)
MIGIYIVGTTLTTKHGTTIEILNCGNFLLDGGGMFGRVPKVMWEKWFPADEQNRIVMATNILHINKQGRTYLVDTGLGSLYTQKDWDILGTTLEQVSLLKEPVDCLICTHLHFDHCGGIQDMTVRSEVIISRLEWEDAHGRSPLSKGSYRKADLDLLGIKLRLVDPPCTLVDGIQVLATPGHTRGHMSVLIDDEVLYPGDLIPTSAHVHLPCIMAYDLNPLEILETKKEILNEAIRKEWRLVFEHDPYRPISRIGKLGTKYLCLDKFRDGNVL